MGVRQPTVSRHVRLLEDEIGVSLFSRARSGVSLTAAGRCFYRDAQLILVTAERAAGLALRAGRAELGDLAIGFFTSLASGRLQALLAEHRRRWPDVHPTLHEGTNVEHLMAIRERRLDLAVTVGELNETDLLTEPLWRERVYVALPTSHALAGAADVGWSELRRETWVTRLFDSGPVVGNWLVARVASDSYLPRISEHRIARENTIGLVAAGFGVTVVMESGASVRYPGVVILPIRDENAEVALTLVARLDDPNLVLRRFLSFARAEAAQTREPPAAQPFAG